jgi:modulator of FtsH protease HflC
MRSLGIFGLAAIFFAIVLLLNSVFIVDQRKQALILELGRAVRVINEPGDSQAGLHFKIPLVQNVIYYDKRNLGLDIQNIEAIDGSQELLLVDAFVRYQIIDPRAFYQKLTSTRAAEIQIGQFANTAIRTEFAKKKRRDIISGQRAELMDNIRKSLVTSTDGLGIKIIDVRVRQADLPQDVSEKVYEQMTAARNKEAELIRAEGDRDATEIRARAERERTVLIAEARREAEQIRGEGDGKRNEIYAAAYGKDAEFFRFQRALIACEEALSTGTQIVVAPNNLSLCDEFINSARQSSNR